MTVNVNTLFRLPETHTGLRWLLLLCLCLLPALVWANPLPNDIDVAGNSDLTTIWVVGDIDVIARAFNAVAMFFNTAGGGSQMIGLLKLGALMALLVMLGQFITKRTFEPLNLFLMIIIASALFIPKTSVWVASYYDATGGATGGAVGFRKVDNVPVGVAYPLGVFSKIAKELTSSYDTAMQTLPDSSISGSASAVPEGGILVHGAEGYFSPLKAVLRLRNQFSAADNSILLANLANASQVCNWSDRWGDAEKGGIFNVLARGRQTGMTQVMVPAADPKEAPVIGLMSCADAGKLLSVMMLQNVVDLPGKAYSPTAVRAADSRSLDSVKGQSVNQGERYAKTQEELSQLPKAMAAAAGGDTSRSASIMGVGDPNALIATVRTQMQQGQIQPTALAQLFTSANAVSAAEIEANMVFSRIVQDCVGANDATCVRQAYMMTEARNRAAVDAAGEASLFQTFMGHSMNVLMFIYVVMAPIMIFIIMVMGWAGIRLLGAYLLFAAWINSWLPLNSAVAYYMLQNYTNRMHEMLLMIASSSEPGRIYSPTVMMTIFDGTRDMLASASTMMSSVPLVMLALMSGSIYGMVQLAQRANMVGKDFIDEDKAAPKLDEAEAIAMSRMLQNSSAGGTLSTANFDQNVMSNADATNPANISLQTSHAAIDSARHSVAAKLQMLEGATEARSLAQTNSEGVVTQTGLVYAQTLDGQDVARMAYEGEHSVKASEKFAIGVGADGVMKAVSGELGANGDTVSSVTYTDSNGNTHTMTEGTSISDSQGITTSFGTMNTQQLSSSLSQQMSDAREDMRSIEQATSDTVSHGFSTSINRTGFAALVSNDAAVAQQQLLAGAVAASQHNTAAGMALQEAARGSSSDYFNTLTRLATGSNSEQMAALAGIQGLAAANPAGHGQAYANMAQGALAVREHAAAMQSSNQNAIDAGISSGNAQNTGRFDAPLNAGAQLGNSGGFGASGNTSAAMPPGAAMPPKDGLSLQEKQQVMAYNKAKMAEMTEFNNSVLKEYNNRSPVDKYLDYAQADAWKAWNSAGDQWSRGEYGAAAVGYTVSALDAMSLGAGRLFRDASGVQEKNTSGLSDTSDAAFNEKINQMNDNLQKMQSFNMSDSSKTIDGTPIEKIIGRSLESPSNAGSYHGGISLTNAAANAQSGFADPFKRLILKGEGNYNSVNLGQRHGSRADTRNLSEMTVSQIAQAQQRGEFNAVGKYQMIKGTFADGVKALGLSGNEKFTPALQERFFSDYLLKKAGGGALLNYVQGKAGNLESALLAAAKEWASFPVPKDMTVNDQFGLRNLKAGQSYYHGIQGNRAHIKLSDATTAIQAMRNNYSAKK